jgi:hypothetical protein
VWRLAVTAGAINVNGWVSNPSLLCEIATGRKWDYTHAARDTKDLQTGELIILHKQRLNFNHFVVAQVLDNREFHVIYDSLEGSKTSKYGKLVGLRRLRQIR